jgi:hypothetical protein
MHLPRQQSRLHSRLRLREHVLSVQSGPGLDLVLNEQPVEKPGLQGSKAVPDEACEGCHGVAAKRELVQGGDLKLVVPLGALGKGAGAVAALPGGRGGAVAPAPAMQSRHPLF